MNNLYLAPLKLFYQQHEKQLINSYPGLTLKRLVQEAEDWKKDWKEIEQDLKNAVPLQYISGTAYFYQSKFFVNSDVLIPRSETEQLVEMVSHKLKKNPEMKTVLDLGTGSGAIILSLKKEHPKLEAWASDISEPALSVAKKNAHHLNLKINWVQADRLKTKFPPMDIIVSNPPYIKKNADQNKVHPQVVKYEPHTALFLDDDIYTRWYKELFQDVGQLLKPNGMFLMEGHEDHLNALKDLASSLGMRNTTVFNDYSEQLRFLTFEVK